MIKIEQLIFLFCVFDFSEDSILFDNLLINAAPQSSLCVFYLREKGGETKIC